MKHPDREPYTDPACLEFIRNRFAPSWAILDWKQTADSIALKPFIKGLAEVLQPFTGGSCPLQISYCTSAEKATLQLGDDWRIHPTDELILRLKKFLSAEAVEVRYRQ